MDMVSSGAFFYKQVLSRDMGHIGVFLVCDVRAYQALFLHALTSICPHIPCCSSNILSIQGNYNPPNIMKLHSPFGRIIEDGLHYIC